MTHYQGAGLMETERRMWLEEVKSLFERIARVEVRQDSANERMEKLERDLVKRLDTHEGRISALGKRVHALHTDMNTGFSSVRSEHKKAADANAAAIQKAAEANVVEIRTTADVLRKDLAAEAQNRKINRRWIWGGGVGAVALLSSGSDDLRALAVGGAKIVLTFLGAG